MKMAPPIADNSASLPTRRASTRTSKQSTRKRSPPALQHSLQVSKKPKPKPKPKPASKPSSKRISTTARQSFSQLLLSPYAWITSNAIEIVDDEDDEEALQE